MSNTLSVVIEDVLALILSIPLGSVSVNHLVNFYKDDVNHNTSHNLQPISPSQWPLIQNVI